jgi:HPr kinase/phosphorylase
VTAEVLHASCVSVQGSGLLILGASGTGKSALALRMIGLGAQLVSDDLTHVAVASGRLIASCPSPAQQGLIEARGLGILRAPSVDRADLVLAIDLDQREHDRLPPYRSLTTLGVSLALVLHPQNDHFPDALMLYLRHGRQA